MTRQLLTLSMLLSCSACGPIMFSTELKGQATVQGSTLGQLLSVFPQVGGFADLNFDQNADFQNNKAQRQHVKSMKATSFTITIASPNSQDYAFLDSIEFAAKADGVAEAKIASKSNIGSLGLAAPNPTLTLDVESTDLSAFVRAPTMTIISRGTGRQPSQDTTLEAKVKFDVGVGL